MTVPTTPPEGFAHVHSTPPPPAAGPALHQHALPSPSYLTSPSPTAHVVWISLAILLSSGVVFRTLQPKFRRGSHSSTSHDSTSSQHSSTTPTKGKKRKESVLKSILQAQEAADLASSSGADPRGGGGGGSNTGGGFSRSRSASSVASTSLLASGSETPARGRSPGCSSAIAQGLSLLSSVATGASSSAASRPGSGAVTPVSAGPTLVPPPFLAQTGSRKSSYSSKGKKGKGSASPSSLAPPPPFSSTPSHSPSPASSPRRKNAATHTPAPPTADASVQTTPPRSLDPEDPSFEYPPLPPSPPPTFEYPLPPFTPSPPSPHFRDAHIQTSPVPLPTARRPTLPYDLHASFQSTPPPRPPASPPAPHSPSPSSSRSLPLLSPNPSPSTSNTRNRKQQARAKAAALVSAASQPPQNIVGLPRAARSREPTDESDAGGGVGPATGNLLASPSVGRTVRGGVSAFSARMGDSPESASIALPNLSNVSATRGLTPPSSKGKGKERERDSSSVLVAPTVPQRAAVMMNGATLMPSSGGSMNRYGIPSPIPIPPLSDHASSAAPHRRMSTHSSASSQPGQMTHAPSSAASSSSSSPYLSHLSLVTSPASIGPRGAPPLPPLNDGDAYWRHDLRHERVGWEPDSVIPSGVVGLGVDVETDERGRPRRPSGTHVVTDARTWSQAAGAIAGRRESVSSRASSPSAGQPGGGPDGFFPGQAQSTSSELLSPPTSPDPTPASQPAVPFQSMASPASGRPWSPHLSSSGAAYPILPFPPNGSGPLMNGMSNGNGAHHSTFQSRPSSRQSSLSVPITSPRDQQSHQQQQQQQHLFQQHQQAYAFAHAQAQAQYHHAVAMQLHAQQVHASQAAQRQQRLQHELQHQDGRPPPSSTSSEPGGGPNQTPARNGNGNGNGNNNGGHSPRSSAFQTPGSKNSDQRWASVPPSPSLTGPLNIAHSASPTSGSFPHMGHNPYYGPPPTNPFLSYHLTQSLPHPSSSQSSLQANGNPRHASQSSKVTTNGGRESRKSSPRLGGPEKSSGGKSGQPSSTNGSNNSGVIESTGWKVKLRTAEMEADRNGKELEIARWRLAVLEEDRITAELDNQEALAALANRAKRAEARLKLLEEARQPDSSSASASGSGSPATRPSSIMEGADAPSSRSTVDDDLVRFASPPGVVVHPLAWLDLDSITFNTTPSPSRTSLLTSPSNGRPHSNNSKAENRRSNRLSTGPEMGNQRRRSGNQRRRSTNSHMPDASTSSPDPSSHAPSPNSQLLDSDDDDVVIVLDSPLRKRPPRLPSRRSSFLQDEDGLYPNEGGSFGADDDDVSNVDLDNPDNESSDEQEHLDYTGFLPTFLTTQPSSSGTEHSSDVTVSPDPGAGDLLPPSPASVKGFVLPSFTLDCATPGPDQQDTPVSHAASPSPSDEDDNEQTPQLPPHESPIELSRENAPPILSIVT